MARVDFYILPEGNPVERFACSVTAKAWVAGNRVHIHTSDETSAAHVDDLLWIYRDISFIPHERFNKETGDDTQVTIGCTNEYPEAADVLINLSATIPEFSANFARIVEIVGGNEENKKLARQRYRDYRADDSHEIHDQKMDKVN